MSLRKLQDLRFVILALAVMSPALVVKEANFLYAAETEETSSFIQQGQEKAAQRPKAQSYTVRRAASEIKIDGALEEKAWSEAAVIKLPYEWWPGDNIPAPVNTECLVTFDNKNFYIAFRCFDPDPSQIRAHLMDRDATDTLIQDDHISVMLDTFNDERRGFQFRVNPLGVQADANFSESEGYEDFSWDAIWSSAGSIEDWGYAIEMAIPFNQLRFPQTSEVQIWGFSAERSYPRNVRHRMTSHRRDRNLSCIICQFNKISGIQGISPKLNLEFDPTLTAVRTDKRESFPSGPMAEGKGKADPGLTLRWGVTPNLILNAAVNPDFSQVEADVAQLEVNTRFALRYPEKRPFFLEGADFFLTPFEAVFTRTVADPDGGVKITGKVGKNAFGFFGTYDRINNLIFPSNQGSASASIDSDVSSGVFRYRRDIGQNSTLGVLYTGRMAEDYLNHVAGLDGFLRLSKTKSISFQYLHSETDYPDVLSLAYGQKLGDFGGDAFTATFLHVGRNWQYGAGYRDLYPGFRADHGYIPRVDTRTVAGMLARVLWGKSDGWFTQIVFGAQGAATCDHQGNLTDRNIDLSLNYLGPLQSTFTVDYARNRELYLNQSYELEVFSWGYELKPAGGLRFGFNIQSGDSVDYYNQRRARVLRFMPNIEMGLGRQVNINFMHVFEGLALGSEKIYEANLSQLRLVFNLNVRTFVRAIVQYLNVTRNPALYLLPLDPKTNTLFTQFLFSYKLNPQTVLFIGYSDNYLGMTGIDITQTDRTFFVKLGYAWTR